MRSKINEKKDKSYNTTTGSNHLGYSVTPERLTTGLCGHGESGVKLQYKLAKTRAGKNLGFFGILF